MNTVCFRNFEERDVDFIYKCKNDENLNSLTVGHSHPLSYEDAKNWVHGCMGEHDTYKFWAIATNDEEKRIVGWLSLSSIDYVNHSADFHGIVIGDENYRFGYAWIESYLFILDYSFNILKLHRLTGSNLVTHRLSTKISDACFMKIEGVQKDAVRKDNNYIDVIFYAILKNDYILHKKNGDYELDAVVERLLNKN